jgi:uncharacterized protein YndB with AHSA1/START domain
MSEDTSSFVYVTYIRTTADALWAALTTPEFTRRYWFGMNLVAEWREGAAWTLSFPDGRVADTGEIVELDPPRRIVLRWRHRLHPEPAAEGEARCCIEIAPQEGAMKLTITHTSERPRSKLIEKVSDGWPKVLSNLKSLLETDRVVLN